MLQDCRTCSLKVSALRCLMFLLQVTGAFGSSMEVMISVCSEPLTV